MIYSSEPDVKLNERHMKKIIIVNKIQIYKMIVQGRNTKT